MRVAELSRTSGVPVPSIKYYLRAGLLPPGERTAPNQADYGQSHVHRLRLIRALLEVGGLSVAATKEVLSAIESHGANLHEALGSAFAATLPGARADEAEHTEAANQTAEALIERHGWKVDRSSKNYESLVSALSVLYRLSADDVTEIVDAYARHADELGTTEVDWVSGRADVDSAVEAAVVGTFIGGAVFNAMRVIVHEHVSRQNFDR